jgi:D-amino peptidase
MEGASRIADHRECWPPFREYWKLGRQKLTDDVVATAGGLLEGGATEVVVTNAHGLGWPNVLWDQLPDGARPAGEDGTQDFDAMFQVGFHARYGTGEGFVSHTMLPRFEVTVDGIPVTESHIWAWLAGIPLLGVTGDAALGDQLDGTLRGTPFLAVKRSSSRSDTTPLYPDRAASSAAIRQFARDRVSTKLPVPPALPRRFKVGLLLEPELADLVAGRAGLSRSGAGVLSIEAEDWGRDVQPALQVAMGAASRPLLEAQADLDLRTEEALAVQDPAKLERFRKYFAEWVEDVGVSP